MTAKALMKAVIVTTAALPWFTGTSTNPLGRAISMAQLGSYAVTLLIPWVPRGQQKYIFKNLTFKTCRQQRLWIEAYVKNVLTMPVNINIGFYKAVYSQSLKSIFPIEKLKHQLKGFDLALLEEPEHLFFFQHARRQEIPCSLVVGILHTNYPYYFKNRFPLLPLSRKAKGVLLKKYFFYKLSHVCDAVIALNAPVGYNRFPVVHTNGLFDIYFPTRTKHYKTFYFIGKVIKEKNVDKFLYCLAHRPQFEIDVYGPDAGLAELQHAQKAGRLVLLGELINPAKSLAPYKAFINPSVSEVYCTTTAEALAMQKFVILPAGHGNECFYKYSNCLIYRSQEELLKRIDFVLSHQPEHDEAVKELCWKAATRRLLNHIDSIPSV